MSISQSMDIQLDLNPDLNEKDILTVKAGVPSIDMVKNMDLAGQEKAQHLKKLLKDSDSLICSATGLNQFKATSIGH